MKLVPSANGSLRPRRSSHRGRIRAFTLIELTVALVAGLLVAMAVATLSHEATATFNEEVRISATEATLRTAADRLRADLQRASFMSTANIEMDPMISRPFGQAAPLLNTATAAAKGLQGILFTPGTTALNTTNGLALDSKNNLTPARIDITGNLSSSDAFNVQTVLTSGACCQVTLSGTSPAIFRLLNSNAAGVPDPNADTELQNIFAPAPPPAGSTFTKAQFWVRFTDAVTGKSEFILTCKTGGLQIAGVPTVGGVVQPYLLLNQCPLTGAQTQYTGTNGNTLGFVNPVATARWEVVAPNGGGTIPPQQDINALDNSPLEAGADVSKYDLVRSLVDGNGNLLPETTEVIAEYAVNLDFAFSVDTGAGTAGANPAIQSYDFGNPLNANTASSVVPLNTNQVNGPNPPDPQRIRSVKFMIETRAASADRTASIPTAGDAGGGTFLYRYCMNAAGCSGTSLVQWARVRTLVSEVALPNQQQAFY